MTKIISISDEAYDYLKSIKDEKESFTKIILRVKPKNDQREILELSGAIKDESFFKAMKQIIKDRSKFKSREVSFD